MVPLFNETGAWSGRPMAPQNITSWLRAVLGKDFPEATRLSSHSLKATELSWAASAGVPLDTRRLLAHHVRDGARSTETYSRDVLAPAARVFEEVLLAIRAGDFAPDNCQGSQFAGKNNTLRLSKSHPWWTRTSSSDPGNRPRRIGRWPRSRTFLESEDDMPLDPPLPVHLVDACHQRMPARCRGPHGEERLLCGRKLSDRYFCSDVQELDEGRPHCLVRGLKRGVCCNPVLSCFMFCCCCFQPVRYYGEPRRLEGGV